MERFELRKEKLRDASSAEKKLAWMKVDAAEEELKTAKAAMKEAEERLKKVRRKKGVAAPACVRAASVGGG